MIPKSVSQDPISGNSEQTPMKTIRAPTCLALAPTKSSLTQTFFSPRLAVSTQLQAGEIMEVKITQLYVEISPLTPSVLESFGDKFPLYTVPIYCIEMIVCIILYYWISF